jgi:2-polyprenyl-3-methyl-5-hydroxy-6-metoxy-1,4-benzoquinol methylase
MGDCRVCGGDFRSTFLRGQAQYGRCARCGAVNKVLTEQEYQSLNPTYDPGDLIEADATDILDRLDVEGKVRFLRKLLGRSPARAGTLKLLDVGCGAGGYLLAAQAMGMTARGVEPSESHSRVGRERFGLDITTGYLVPEEMTERFDIVILSHVIEHIYQPGEFMTRLATVLAPGGVLVVVTPNAGSPLARLSGPAWSMLAPIDHVTMLGPRGLLKVTPQGYKCTWRTDEYIWEPAATVLVALRNQLRGASAEEDQSRNNAVQGAAKSRVLDNRLFRFGLSAVSAPFWLAFSALKCGGCLVAEYRKPAAA